MKLPTPILPYSHTIFMNSKDKIKSRAEIIEIASHLRKAGRKIVTTNGAFDLLHPGHVKMLQEAKSLGDVLIVGVNSDASIRRFKGPHRPIYSERDRAEMLAALACTDYITIFDELTPVTLLDHIRPHIHVNSPEHGYDCIEKEVVLRHGGEIYLSKLIEGLSTSSLIEKILHVYSQPSYKAVFLDPETLFKSPQLIPPMLDNFDEEVLRVLPGFLQADYRLIILANHPEVAMGQLTEQDLKRYYGAVQQLLKSQGIELAGIYFCPHHPEGNVASYRVECSCRKPRPGLIEQAVSDLNLNLARSFVISKGLENILMGREINCKTILVESPSGRGAGIVNSTPTQNPQRHFYVGPHFRVEDFEEALNLITTQQVNKG
ncbi:MAG TPA: HAD-IIIA family hydrolase [Candidatus Limnocylindrales bacterium]|nr:HAD-IIIA family hydrolase [Candidatus Limnocylindrales bacterium]